MYANKNYLIAKKEELRLEEARSKNRNKDIFFEHEKSCHIWSCKEDQISKYFRSLLTKCEELLHIALQKLLTFLLQKYQYTQVCTI